MWKIEYNNDVGPEDETFWEWWEITNGEIVFETLKEKDAQWLCKILNQDEGCDSPYLIDKEKSENLPK
jgi:hypothetical protein